MIEFIQLCALILALLFRVLLIGAVIWFTVNIACPYVKGERTSNNQNKETVLCSQ